MPVLPALNQDTLQLWKRFNERIQEPEGQKKIILVAVCIALLLDNMLYMVIVPIIPDYLREIGAWTTHTEGGTVEFRNISNKVVPMRIGGRVVYEGEAGAVGVLFASKAMIQLFVNPFSGAIIDRIGYDIPMMIGLSIMFFSTAVFACGKSYGLLFFARSLQGVGSAFADTGGLAMIADRFTEQSERERALGIALSFVAFGSLFAPPFGGLLYEFCGKELPFILLALVCLLDGFLVLVVMSPVKQQMKEAGISRPAGTPIYVLLRDPYIAVCAGALVMGNMSLAFVEPTISIWMQDTMQLEEWQIGMIWLPAFFPYVLGVYTTVKLAAKYPRYQWLTAAVGLALAGAASFVLPFSKSFWVLFIPIAIICFGEAQVSTAILPTLGFLVDTRYVSVYGSIYAIADISYSLAYAFGPIIAGSIVSAFGFLTLNILIAFCNLSYCPVLARLRFIYDYNPFEGDANAALQSGDQTLKQYQTYNDDNEKGNNQQQQQQRSITVPMSVTGVDENPWGDEPQQHKSNPFVTNNSDSAFRTANQFEMRANYSSSNQQAYNYGGYSSGS
ncbi:vesicular acetylcholine transporter-like protein [Leptotrombidium deliense]|uniref:Vesicular acetylcholine transporter-like protein n=1 Tax=Leptotrombidium deliense TaxID=299467 RepID=A0A443SU95_9ACAR|nr:vesicular acetylcholine transporter-like protein [Leptotrombidium deliense]